ncbi:hypothetical protein AB3H13_26940 [Escherichia coli]|uniref:hypothetical protein n=1 Tax=Escherichia coli TaxID=562 RepID=UPI003466CEA8|nr:hypothetical protein [Escherichia coli]HCI0273579.1 hypothetical protein [Escherichia coli]HCI3360042.1 hypothetical protein [Escherichia coli]HCI3410984.1 hypothetical protein [Escherichia coli]HCI3685500.1 hypothetical protein [Escherichia coli]
MTTKNHPAHGPVSLDRLHQIRETLSKAAAQSDGGNLGYAMADAVKVIAWVLSIPATLPCPVHLEPGLKFGKGVRTQCVLDALRRRTDYYAELEAMTPEQRAEHDAGVAEFKAMIGNGSRGNILKAGNSPVTPDGSVPLLRRWLAFGRGMQKAGSKLPRNLIAETEVILAAALQQEVKSE